MSSVDSFSQDSVGDIKDGNVELSIVSPASSCNKHDKNVEYKVNDIAEDSEKFDEDRDPYLLEWDPDDPDFPVNWSNIKRAFVLFQIMLLTSVTYMGSSIYTPGQLQVQEEFGVGHVTATLNLSLYVLGYGLGPLLFSPLSEFSILGRQLLYTFTLFAFTVLQIGCATVQNFGGLVVLRFLSGIFCSPSLSTGGATIADVLHPEYVPLFLGLWDIGAVSAPVLAPLLGGAMVVAVDWRWIFWLSLWLSAGTLITLALFFPETHHDNILYRRARRLRKQTGDDRWSTKSAEKERKLKLGHFLLRALYKPIEIIAKDPIVLAIDCYMSLMYGIFYIFFEAFPLVFADIYNFNLIESGLAFFGFQVGCFSSYPLYILFLKKYVDPKIEKGTSIPEDYLVLTMIVAFLLPAALFIFGWTARVHWILPIFAEVLFSMNSFGLFQGNFSYLAICYPEHVASVFAGNGLARSVFACAFPLFGKALFNGLATEEYPVAWGSSLLGFVAVAMGVIPFAIHRYGPYLRSKSQFSV